LIYGYRKEEAFHFHLRSCKFQLVPVPFIRITGNCFCYLFVLFHGKVRKAHRGAKQAFSMFTDVSYDTT
jgi:hypothetical protein